MYRFPLLTLVFSLSLLAADSTPVGNQAPASTKEVPPAALPPAGPLRIDETEALRIEKAQQEGRAIAAEVQLSQGRLKELAREIEEIAANVYAKAKTTPQRHSINLERRELTPKPAVSNSSTRPGAPTKK